MRWPWVGVGRLDDAKEEVAWLRERNEEITGALTRFQRFQSGMTETPRPERREMEPMPPELVVHLDGIGNPSIKRDVRSRCYRRHAAGEEWAVIVNDILTPPTTEGEE